MPYSPEHKAKSKDRILNAATELFCRFGFEKVSISQIMQRARMTHGAFYNHFESKEALYRATFLEPLKGSRAARLVKGPLSLKHLTALVTHYWNLSEVGRKERPGHEMILFNEIGNENAEVRKLFERSYSNLRRMLEVRITALSRLNRLPFEPDREVIAEKARAILASLVGAVATARSLSDDEERHRILQATQKQILTMLGVDGEEFDTLFAGEVAAP
ncbi:hypothetical protein KBTX_00708 [wastewater metagenome]|uniref:HTH tetR-type domain-containing protein n=2 Tax=unclassified sequences TaxID=12908 RepID=A0A5B8R6X2_9ZZZZ|nr:MULTISPECIES: TetR/AcrR family transcriptional regulator [Arhodomonas]MCS4502572.1 TetR/AcrR family transcriptional regulator [Arhodomonas aquaeolei]QEA04400.1 hypothetical protein KBTEX_00708 [uncultured organism]